MRILLINHTGPLISEKKESGTIQRVDNEKAFRHALETAEWDLLLVRQPLPDLTAEKAVEIARRYSPALPTVLLAGISNFTTLIRLLEKMRLELDRESCLSSGSCELLLGILNSLPQAVSWKDALGKYLGCNAVFAEAVGLACNEIIGKTDAELPWSPEEAEIHHTYHKEAVDNARPMLHFIHSIRKNDGTLQWLDITQVPRMDEDGRVESVIGIYDDITSRKQREENSRAREAMFSNISESIPGVIYQFYARDDGSMGFHYLSPQAYEQFNLTENWKLGANVYPEDLPRFLASADEAIKNISPWSFEGRWVDRTGDIRWFRGMSQPTKTENEIVFSGVLLDITDPKRWEQALQQSEETYRLLFENSADMIWLLRDGEFTRANPAAAKILGYDSSNELVGLTPAEISPEVQPDGVSSQEKATAYITDALEKGPQSFEWLHKKKDGSTVYCQISLTAYPVDSEVRIQAIGRDISERKHTEAAMRLEESRLEALLTLNQMTQASVQELTAFAMEEGVRLTGSSIGYVAFVDEEQKILTMQSWSRQAMEECRTTKQPLEYPVETTGLWGEAIRQGKPIVTNDYSAPSEWKKGYPEGHIQLTRHMNVPIFDGDRIVVVAGVGNKETDYDDSDVHQLTLLMEGMWRIMQRHQSEVSIRKVNRMLRVLSSANEALIRATNEKELLDDVCRIAVDVGGHIMAWVGFIQNDPNKTITPVAHCGREDGFLSNIKLSWDDSVYGLGPTGIAVRTGEPAFVCDIAADEHFRPWREGALQRGYYSTVSLPLKGEDKPIGIITLYSDVPESFADEEMELLGELAADLSYGIMTLRNREQRKRAEMQLRASEERYRSLIELSPTAIYLHRGDRIFYANPTSLRLFGAETQEDLLEKSPYDLFHPAYHEKIRARIQTLREGHSIPIAEEKIVRLDGSTRSVEVTAAPFVDQDGPAIQVMLHDISERVEAEDALRQSEMKYRNLYESMIDGFVILDMESNILEFNQPYRAMLSYCEEELRGMNHLQITAQERVDYEQGILESEVLKRGYSNTFEMAMRRKDGSMFPAEMRIYLLRDERGRPSGMWSIVRDITERKHLEEEKRQFYREAIRSVTDGKLEIVSRETLYAYESESDFVQMFGTSEDLSATRQIVHDCCFSKGLDGDALGLFTTAVGEAMTNALKHAGGGRVFCGGRGEELWVSVSDAGFGIATLTLPSATLRRGYSTKVSMGMGYSIMLEVSDAVMLSTGTEGTTVIMFKNTKAPRPKISLRDLPDTWETIPPIK